jgi:hypothetical protein
VGAADVHLESVGLVEWPRAVIAAEARLWKGKSGHSSSEASLSLHRLTRKVSLVVVFVGDRRRDLAAQALRTIGSSLVAMLDLNVFLLRDAHGEGFVADVAHEWLRVALLAVGHPQMCLQLLGTVELHQTALASLRRPEMLVKIPSSLRIVDVSVLLNESRELFLLEIAVEFKATNLALQRIVAKSVLLELVATQADFSLELSMRLAERAEFPGDFLDHWLCLFDFFDDFLLEVLDFLVDLAGHLERFRGFDFVGLKDFRLVLEFDLVILAEDFFLRHHFHLLELLLRLLQWLLVVFQLYRAADFDIPRLVRLLEVDSLRQFVQLLVQFSLEDFQRPVGVQALRLQSVRAAGLIEASLAQELAEGVILCDLKAKNQLTI